MDARELRFEVSPRSGSVSALYERPRGAHCLYVLAHGAGAGMRHAFMERISAELLARKIAIFRYQFPHMEAGRRSPSPRAVLIATVRAALREAQGLASRGASRWGGV